MEKCNELECCQYNTDFMNNCSDVDDIKLCIRQKSMIKLIKKFADAWKVYGVKEDWFWARKKPVNIKVIQILEDFEVETLEGNHKGHAGDYLIQGVKGEVYPCRKDIFEETYKKV